MLAIVRSLWLVLARRTSFKLKIWTKTCFHFLLLQAQQLVTEAFIWSHLATPGHTWQLLGTPGNTISALCWSLLATPGHKLQDMVAKCQKVTLLSKNGFWALSATSGHINCQMVTSGNLWSHNWQHCSYTILVSIWAKFMENVITATENTWLS